MNMITKQNNELYTIEEWYSEFKNYIEINNIACPRIECFYMYGDFNKPNKDITDKVPEYLKDRKIVNYDYNYTTPDMNDCFLIILMYE